MLYLRTWQMSPRTRRVIELLGMIGTIARGLAQSMSTAGSSAARSADTLDLGAAAAHRSSSSPGSAAGGT